MRARDGETDPSLRRRRPRRGRRSRPPRICPRGQSSQAALTPRLGGSLARQHPAEGLGRVSDRCEPSWSTRTQLGPNRASLSVLMRKYGQRQRLERHGSKRIRIDPPSEQGDEGGSENPMSRPGARLPTHGVRTGNPVRFQLSQKIPRSIPTKFSRDEITETRPRGDEARQPDAYPTSGTGASAGHTTRTIPRFSTRPKVSNPAGVSNPHRLAVLQYLSRAFELSDRFHNSKRAPSLDPRQVAIKEPGLRVLVACSCYEPLVLQLAERVGENVVVTETRVRIPLGPTPSLTQSLTFEIRGVATAA